MIDDVEAGLITFMESGATSAKRWDLFTLTLRTGTVLRYTDRDWPITLPDGRSFACGPLLERSRLSVVAGLEVDALTVKLKPRSTDLVAGVPLLQMARVGGFRGCDVLLEWAYFDAGGTYKGRMARFYGSGSPVALEGGVVELNVRSECERLAQQMPRDLYQPACLNTLYDPLCGITRSSKRVNGTVTSVVSRSKFDSGLAQAAGWFERGRVKFTSGANVGMLRTVRGFSGGLFDFALPFPFDIEEGDSFEALPGCNNTLDDCQGKFDNVVRFRGQPFVPAPETTT